ncbi:MAG TPA: pyridoxal phosphate-dependent aminotransferase family protein [Myxococcota bacterium]|nr:pyridoxal phosphate-dependent aminotransferase family protein [Myxococcota bacterium]
MSGYREKIQGQLGLLQMLRSSGLDTYEREVTSGCGPLITVEGRECINFISNSYMGFSVHPKVIEAARRALADYGLGIGGSPLACGTTRLHLELAEKIAGNYGSESAMVFASGYQALLGTIQGLMGRGDIALLDNLDHRSIIDGCAMSGCKIRTFIHNDMDDLADLVERTSKVDGHRMLIVDSVYSMDGDIAPLPRIAKICRPAGVTICIDEAHSLGILGQSGKGLLEHFDMPDGADVIAGTFSKFAGAVGGFCAADRQLIDFLRHYASPFVFSASIPPAVVAAVSASFDLLTSEPEWHARLWENVHYMLDGLSDLGFDIGNSATPVIPVMIRDTEKVLRMNRRLLDLGVYASAVVHPGVPIKKERLRLGVMATHTRQQLVNALDIFDKVGREFEVIP